MASLNKVFLIGNVTRDIELKYLQSGTAVVEIGVAVTEKYKDKSGEWKEETVFVDVTLWGRTAEVCNEYCSKGSPVMIEGKLKLDSWEKDGKKFSKLRVNGERLQLLGGRRDGGQQQSETAEKRTARKNENPVHNEQPTNNGGEDIPF